MDPRNVSFILFNFFRFRLKKNSPIQMKVVHNQPYDESIDVSDGEEIASNNPTPRASTLDHTGS